MMWWQIIKRGMQEGDLAAMKEINDRLDGRPAQAITLQGDEDNPLKIQSIERIIVKPKD